MPWWEQSHIQKCPCLRSIAHSRAMLLSDALNRWKCLRWRILWGAIAPIPQYDGERPAQKVTYAGAGIPVFPKNRGVESFRQTG